MTNKTKKNQERVKRKLATRIIHNVINFEYNWKSQILQNILVK